MRKLHALKTNYILIINNFSITTRQILDLKMSFDRARLNLYFKKDFPIFDKFGLLDQCDNAWIVYFIVIETKPQTDFFAVADPKQ